MRGFVCFGVVLIRGAGGLVWFCSGRDDVGMGERRSAWVLRVSRVVVRYGFGLFGVVVMLGGERSTVWLDLVWFVRGNNVGRRGGYGLVSFRVTMLSD